MKARSSLRREAMRFLRWRKETRGIGFVELRGRNIEDAHRGRRRQVCNISGGVQSGIAEVDVAFRFNEQHVRGDWR